MRKAVMLLLLCALPLAPGLGGEKGKKSKSEANKALFDKLQGKWKMVKMEIDGSVSGTADRAGLLFEGDQYYFLFDNNKRPNSAKLYLDATKDPATIDLVLAGIGISGTQLGIIRFNEDGYLEICMNQPRGAGSDKRPTSFTTKAEIGAGNIMYTAERAWRDKVDTPAKALDAKPAPSGKLPKKEAIKADLKKLEGKWKMVKLEVNGQLSGNADRAAVLVDGDTLHHIFDGRKDPNSAKIFLDPTKEPRTIDLVLKGIGIAGTKLGIYRFTEDGLEICVNQARGAGSDKRPSAFTTKAEIGAGSVLYIMERADK